MSQSFSLYEARDSGLHRLHPLTKLALTGLLLTAGLTLPSVWLTYAAFAGAVIPLAVWGQVARPLLTSTWRVVLPFSLSLFLIQGLLWPGGTPLVALGLISFKTEGLLFATKLTGRILLIVASFLLLTLSTRPDDLMIALTQLGIPNALAYVVLSTLQIIPRFQAKANTILDAQRSRGLETQHGVLRRLRALLPLVAPLVMGSIVDIEERAIALEARGFSRQGPKTYLRTLKDTSAQAAARWLLLATMLALVLARLFWIH